MPKKLTYNQVKQVFEDGGCELLSNEYKNAATKLKYRCECGSVSTVFLHNFKRGHRCKKCGIVKIKEKLKFSYEYVKQYFKDNNCILLSNFYKNNLTKLNYICQCKNISKISFIDFKSGKRCKKCGYKKISDRFKHLYSYVKEFFDNNNCTLISREYTNAHEKLDYICECGGKARITFNEFRQGGRCERCWIDRNSGKNHYNYNPNITDEERKLKRFYPGYIVWRTGVYERDNYICQCCFQRGGKLNAHHIQNYSSNKELRLEGYNGVTLCRNCHKEFHKKYGKKNNNKTQLDEFLRVINLCLK